MCMARRRLICYVIASLASETDQIGLYLDLAEELRELPLWSEAQVRHYLP